MQKYLRPMVFGVTVLILLAIPVVLIALRSYFLAPTEEPPKPQPIDFPHAFHVQTLGLDCTFCHREASTTADAGVPALEQCMFCHKVVPTAGKPGLQKLVNAYDHNQPIDWMRVTQLPDHVHFVHATHINAGIACQTCHGPVQNMAPGAVYQYRNLEMGDCISCHKEMNARTDCSVCHY